MIPAMQRGDPQWSELRAVGVGWWIRNINTLRKMVEKVLDKFRLLSYFNLLSTVARKSNGTIYNYLIFLIN